MKSKYSEVVEKKFELIEGWVRSGLTNEQVAKNLGISKVTLYKYRDEHPELAELLKRTKEIVDYEVENALYKKAMEGNIAAIIFWLKNRRPDKWKDRREHEEIEIMKRELALKERKLQLEIDKLKKIIDDEITINITVADEDIKLRRAAL